MTDAADTKRPDASSAGYDLRTPSPEQMRQLTAALTPEEDR